MTKITILGPSILGFFADRVLRGLYAKRLNSIVLNRYYKKLHVDIQTNVIEYQCSPYSYLIYNAKQILIYDECKGKLNLY